jgi:hypothetical protein
MAARGNDAIARTPEFDRNGSAKCAGPTGDESGATAWNGTGECPYLLSRVHDLHAGHYSTQAQANPSGRTLKNKTFFETLQQKSACVIDHACTTL